MASSFRRVLSSRANGRLSRGPKTDAGKRRSSLNSYRHGCRAKALHVPDDKLPQYHDLCKQILSEHQLPAIEKMTLGERFHFGQMIQAQWRMRCTVDLQQEMVDAFCAAHPEITNHDDILTE